MILHVDGDAFFASCEQAKNPKLKGKPVVTGKERGIASAMSYEAKSRGVMRGMPLHKIREVCPDCIILASDYETYSMYSERMYEIVRRYTPKVEEYSIDECFADISKTELLELYTLEDALRKIKRDLEGELNLSFSLGLAPTKCLAKVASDWNKPSGCAVIRPEAISESLSCVPVEDVWGIGKAISRRLRAWGIETAEDFRSLSEIWVRAHFNKPVLELWHELNGRRVLAVEIESRVRKSIQKSKTFTPATNNPHYIFSQLSKNIENACMKARRHHLRASSATFFIKTKDYRYYSWREDFERLTHTPKEVLDACERGFRYIFNKNIQYRSTGVVLEGLQDASYVQSDMFGGIEKDQALEEVYARVDKLREKYGKYTVHLASSMEALGKQWEGERNAQAARVTYRLPGETERRRLALPFLGEVR